MVDTNTPDWDRLAAILERIADALEGMGTKFSEAGRQMSGISVNSVNFGSNDETTFRVGDVVRLTGKAWRHERDRNGDPLHMRDVTVSLTEDPEEFGSDAVQFRHEGISWAIYENSDDDYSATKVG